MGAITYQVIPIICSDVTYVPHVTKNLHMKNMRCICGIDGIPSALKKMNLDYADAVRKFSEKMPKKRKNTDLIKILGFPGKFWSFK